MRGLFKFGFIVIFVILGFIVLFNTSTEEVKEVVVSDGTHVSEKVTLLTIFNNLPNDFTFAPVLVVVHNDNLSLDFLGKTATSELEYLAEIGDVNPFIEKLEKNEDVLFAVRGRSIAKNSSVDIDLAKYQDLVGLKLSILTMVTESNDAYAFFELDIVTGEYTGVIYDAGTEFNAPIGSGFSNGQPSIEGGHNVNHGIATDPLERIQVHEQFEDSVIKARLR